jgi:hypothetical protein
MKVMKRVSHLIIAGLFMMTIYACKKDSSTLTVPTVISNEPLNNATSIALNKTVTATFSVSMDPLTINATTFTIKLNGTPVAGTVSYTNATATFTPSVSLVPGTYTATITRGAKNISGTALANDYVWTFTTVSLVKRSETKSLGTGYTNDIYYRLSDGLVTSVLRSNWDIAFSVSPREAAILTNGTSGVILKVYPTSAGWSWADPVDTTGYYGWNTLYNSDTTWTEGAFNMNATVHPNYGWGVYDMNTHNLTGISLYIIKTRNTSFKKIWIENKLSSLQKYTFRYADLDGTNEKVVNLDLSGSTKNFVYYSLDTNEELDREPDKDKWDFVFTKYIDKSIQYSVTGVLQNIGVTTLESTDTDPLSYVFPSTGFLTNISTVGSDWKIINMETYQYSIDETRVFFLKNLNGDVFRLKFKSFEGSGTGNLSFDITTIK